MRTLYFCPVVTVFFLSFFSSPNLSRRTLHVYHTSTHDVALVRISDAGLKHAARGSLKIHNTKNSQKFAICAPSHNFVGPEKKKKETEQKYNVRICCAGWP